ncbi:HEAT repeat domain-containing protein [Photobacterium damselae]|uniref:HEAT repeat domain-containing protein n=1 Tax=Photobacterium damselae TaxID=38293 RepID=UPI0010FCEE92|nr:HEAT repeat domain-containing protein [Photobacterium damselae]TLS76795.1 HEAT repeat domain-containing protein [Photobacterium damselae subsp. damselae]TLS87296.1 HEAT repeat domain-containing protein [Photobacterium damselae subsp. damselae]
MDDLKVQLTHAYKDGNFFEFIREIYYQDLKDEKLLPGILTELHNKGQLNLVELFHSLKNETKNHDFFSVRQVFEDVLPHINAPVKDVADCVKHLTLEAGQDMAAYMLLSPFREFCKSDNSRSQDLLEFALTDIDQEFDHLSTAIEAGASNDEIFYTNQAIELLSNENELVKQRAIFALGKIIYRDEKLLDPVAKAILKASISSPSDIILATSMRALFAIISQSSDLECLFLEFLSTHFEHLSDRYVHAASEILSYDGKKVSANVEPELLNICSYTKPENKATINNIDYALARILKRNDYDDCVTFLERLFELSNYQLSVKHFDRFVSELHNNKDTYLSSLLTRWLLSKKVALGKYAADLFRDPDNGASIKFDVACFINESKGVHLFLARKACGWFFNHPKTAISLIESLIIGAPDDELKGIQQLIFHPLCVSYPGSIRDHLETMNESKEKMVKQIASDVLAEYEEYQASVKAALKINELRPSEQDRHTYWRYHNKLMNESMKKARSKSFFTSLFAGNESVLLYGNKSIHYIHHGEQKTRQEVPLSEISTSFELASMHNPEGSPHNFPKAQPCLNRF